jgi:hypothetical protein
MTPTSQPPGRSNAEPSVGPSLRLGFQQSSTHSQALPWTSKKPHGLALKLPTGAVPWALAAPRQPLPQGNGEARSANFPYWQRSASSVPKLKLVPVPARAAYSHSASVANR